MLCEAVGANPGASGNGVSSDEAGGAGQQRRRQVSLSIRGLRKEFATPVPSGAGRGKQMKVAVNDLSVEVYGGEIFRPLVSLD